MEQKTIESQKPKSGSFHNDQTNGYQIRLIKETRHKSNTGIEKELLNYRFSYDLRNKTKYYKPLQYDKYENLDRINDFLTKYNLTEFKNKLKT